MLVATIDVAVDAAVKREVQQEVVRLQTEAGNAVEALKLQQKDHTRDFNDALLEKEQNYADFQHDVKASQETHISAIEQALRWRDCAMKKVEQDIASLEALKSHTLALDARVDDLSARIQNFQVRDFEPLLSFMAEAEKRAALTRCSSSMQNRGLLNELDQVQDLATAVRSMEGTMSEFSHRMLMTTQDIDDRFSSLRSDISGTFEDAQKRIYRLEATVEGTAGVEKQLTTDMAKLSQLVASKLDCAQTLTTLRRDLDALSA